MLSKKGTQIGKFISFEGGEGTGKSTQVKLLERFLNDSGVKSISTREPGGTSAAEEIRNLLVNGETGKLDPFSETLLHFASRRSHFVEKIRPALENGTWVVCDRFIDSSMAYQGIAMGVGKDTIHTLTKLFVEGFSPDLTFVMDLPVREGLGRTETRLDGRNRYEDMMLPFHERVRKGFLKIASEETNRCVVIDSRQKIETINQQIIHIVKQKFKI